MKYAIIDIETSGGSPQRDKVTEIAIYIHNGQQIIDEYVTLVNPETVIPYYITSLTGISNEMVTNSPKFYEIAKKIVDITEGCIFVAHNATFDYNFIKSEFQSLGFDYKRNVLCTVKLSRKLMPGFPSYSLGKLCDRLQIHIADRHRAAGDALATVQLFERLLEIDGANKPLINQLSDSSFDGVSPLLSVEKINQLPENEGVYYFYNEKAELIYIGKSKHIRQRVREHLRNNTSKKAIEMKSNITDIHAEVTGNELIALLLESDEIKKHKPLYNRAQRRSVFAYGIESYTNPEGYLSFKLVKNTAKSNPIISFTSQQATRNFLENLVTEYTLCQKIAGLYQAQGACFHYSIHACNGACVGKESPEQYNDRAQLVVDKFEFTHDNFFIIDKGRHAQEKTVVKIKNGSYCGFGYIDTEHAQNSELLHDCIQKYADNRDVRQIIRSYLRNFKVEHISPFSE